MKTKYREKNDFANWIMKNDFAVIMKENDDEKISKAPTSPKEQQWVVINRFSSIRQTRVLNKH